jgi:hypothetical protein
MKTKYQNFFTFSRSGLTATCNSCDFTINSQKTTSGMKYHLVNVHSIKIEDIQIKTKRRQPPSDDVEVAKKRKLQSSMGDFLEKELLEDKIAKEAAKFGATFRYISRSQLLKKGLASQGLNQPCNASSVRKLVHKSAENKREEVKMKLQAMAKDDNVRFCAVLDEWTSSGNKRYMNVCLHCKGKSTNLGLQVIHGSMDAKEAERLLVKRVSQFGIDFESEIVNISCDGCSVMTRLGKNIIPEQQLCLAHGIHLAVKAVMYVNENEAPIATLQPEDSDAEDDVEHSDDENDNEAENGTPIPPLTARCLAAVTKARRAVKTIKKSPLKNDFLQDLVKKWQKKNGTKEQPLNLQLDCKTRWSSLPTMLESFLRIKEPLQIILPGTCGVTFNDEEFEFLSEINAALTPIRSAVQALCSEDADLLTADTTFKLLFKWLGKQNTPLSQDLLDALRFRYKERRNDVLIGLLRYLHDPDVLYENEVDSLFKMPPKKIIEQLARKLMSRMFKKDLSNEDENETNQEVDKSGNEMTMEEELKVAFQEISNHRLVPQQDNNFKSLSKEMAAFEASKNRTENLEKLYQALLNISPTSVASERAFSISGSFVSQRRSRLSDASVDDLCFLKGYFN